MLGRGYPHDQPPVRTQYFKLRRASLVDDISYMSQFIAGGVKHILDYSIGKGFLEAYA